MHVGKHWISTCGYAQDAGDSVAPGLNRGGRCFGLAMGKNRFGVLWKVGGASEFVMLPLQGAV